MDFQIKTATRAQVIQRANEVMAAPREDRLWLKMVILSSFTVDFLKPYLIAAAADRGIGLEIEIAPYGQIEQQVYDPSGLIYAKDVDIVLILSRLEDWASSLALRFANIESKSLRQQQDELLQRIKDMFGHLRSKNGTSAKIMMANFPLPAWNPYGWADALQAQSQSNLWREMNTQLSRLCRETSDVVVIDAATVSEQIGTSNWRDEKAAWLARAPLSGEAMKGLAVLTTKMIRPWFFPRKKCLVLDMDNTLWGGVLGESGLEGIHLGVDYPGNVFVDFQHRILALYDRGVLLAAASKNNAKDVEQVLAEHPFSFLKKEHFAAFEVHWEDKATSLRRIAEKLNIGIDSLVFFDDNPVERDWVRSQLPEVEVIEVPTSPMGYGKALEESGAFDFHLLTDEDRTRADMYQQESARVELKQKTGSLEDFIRSLDMTLTLGRIDDGLLPRVVQLLGKTNQFNLTTRRHSLEEVRKMLSDGAIGIWGRVQDRFGDSGIVSVAILIPLGGGIWEVDTFLMSCRVIGRQVETGILVALEEIARQHGAKELKGIYSPTSKNKPCADFYSNHGYGAFDETGNVWRQSLDEQRQYPDIFKVINTNLFT